MNHPFLNITLLVFAASLAASAMSFAQLVIPDGAVVPLLDENSPAAKQAAAQIGATLNPNAPPSTQATPAASTGDPVLDDVLDLIRRRGSVVDGSLLDPRRERELVEPKSSGDAIEEISVYLVAESLLRSARRLEKLPNRTAEQFGLIRAMRSQAAKLLIEAISKESRLPGMAP